MKNRILLLLFCVLGWESIAQKNARITGTEAIPIIKLYLPLNRAVYQRVNNVATFKLAGQLGYLGTTQFVSYKVENLDKFGNVTGTYTDWTNFPLGPIAQSGGLFNKDLTLPTGWYSIQVRQKTKFGNFFSLYFSDNIKVGVGEVLFFAGQSNAQGQRLGIENGISRGGTPQLGTPYDCISAINQPNMCKKTYFFPEFNKLTRDTDDANNNSGMKITPNGVFNVWCYEALAKKLVDKDGTVIPVSIFNAAHESTVIDNWKTTAMNSGVSTNNPWTQNCGSGWGGDAPEGQPYFGLRHSLNYYGGMWGARGVVWHQGESDTFVDKSTNDYTNDLNTVINKTREHYNSGLGWAISRVSRLSSSKKSIDVLNGQVNSKNQLANTEWGAYYSDTIVGNDRYDGLHFNKDGLVKLADLYATGTFTGTPSGLGNMGGNLFNLSPVEAQIAPALNATFSNDGNTLTLTVQGNYSSYCWVKGTGKLNECQSNSSSITLPNDRSQPDTDWRCYVKNGSGNYTISQTANTPLSGIRINSKNGLTGTTGSGGTGGFILDAFKLDWTISNIPSWANLNTVTGSDGQTQVNVTFQPNGGAARSATLNVSGSDGAGQLNIDISQAGTNNSSCANVGSISYERWNNVGGYSTDIQSFRNGTNNLQNAPSVTQSLSLFEAPTDVADQYGARIRGYVCPPTSGNYTFWVAGDDNVELWLSSNDQPSNIQRIAYHNS